jgi:predicted nuclease of predicted toxin-antitoxin system
MAPRFYKYKLLLDEGFYRRHRLPRLDQRYDVKHITGDLHEEGLSDAEVYEIARKDNRIVVTYNEKDFRKLAGKSLESGVIGISDNMTAKQIDTKLIALLRKSKPKDLFGKFTPLSRET